jgi:uncharacterized protein (TIGR02145 family)/prepilin-type N-terminal cleavage/methylation domain-containing protein
MANTKNTKILNKAFTLVELIIVITILAILATIWFMSYQSYTTDARDGKRKRDLWSIRTWLEVYQAKNANLPLPDEQRVTITSSWWTISIQWYAGTNVLKDIRATDDMQDSDTFYYTYSVNWTQTKYQLLWLLENQDNIAIKNLINQTYARTDYSRRFPYTIWNKVWILFSWTTNVPLQVSESWSINLTWTHSGTTFKVLFTNTSSTGSMWADLPKIIEDETEIVASNDEAYFNCWTSTVSSSDWLYTYNTKFLAWKCWTVWSMRHWTKLLSASTMPLNINEIEKWCYNDDDSNCNTYWWLYTWYEAMWLNSTQTTIKIEDTTKSVCWQLGIWWHLPSSTDWVNLVAVPSTWWIGNKLSWLMLSLPGVRNTNNTFTDIENIWKWWSSTWSSTSGATSRYLGSTLTTVNSSFNNPGKLYWNSVFCLKD